MTSNAFKTSTNFAPLPKYDVSTRFKNGFSCFHSECADNSSSDIVFGARFFTGGGSNAPATSCVFVLLDIIFQPLDYRRRTPAPSMPLGSSPIPLHPELPSNSQVAGRMWRELFGHLLRLRLSTDPRVLDHRGNFVGVLFAYLRVCKKPHSPTYLCRCRDSAPTQNQFEHRQKISRRHHDLGQINSKPVIADRRPIRNLSLYLQNSPP